MWPLRIVKIDPAADHPFGLESIRQFVQIDRLVFEGPPQPLDNRPRPSMEIVISAASNLLQPEGLRVLERGVIEF